MMSSTYVNSTKTILKLASILMLCLLYSEAKSKCETCKDIVDKFYEGLKTTAKSNFGGGNTHWEEKSLGSYAFSETRLVEIVDNICSDNECHSMLEEYEEAMEQWWFKHYAKKKDTSMHTYLCIERVSGACCGDGKWGPKCNACPGLDENNVCSGRGKCNGNGTREGTGQCECETGYQGDTCADCAANYYSAANSEDENDDDDSTTCEECHASCEGGCTGAGSTACNACKTEGWITDEELGCKDVNECEAEEAVCKEDEFCANNEGSYTCTGCHAACQGCTESGPENCVSCAEGYYKHDDMCKVCHSSCSSSCTDGTAKGCDSCKDGWLQDDEQGCLDINECEETICGEAQYCVNTPGSHKCKDCDAACDGCTGLGNKNCHACAGGYQLQDDKCTDVDECEGEQACGEDERCENVAGSHLCHCKDGFTRKDGICVQKKDEKKKKTKAPSGAYKGPADCSTCIDIVTNIFKGIEATAKSNFGGGNTKWEEQKLGSYLHSETRLTEVLEEACKDNAKKCVHMLERYEETLEKWWFKHFANEKNLDLLTWLCIDRAEVCCPAGTYGSSCKACPGGTDNTCSRHGKCDGDATRKGTGKCKCDDGYSGDLCDQCDKAYFEAAKNATHIECQACDDTCGESGCSGPGPESCEDCKRGYEFDEDGETGCHDINECEAETSPCKDKQVCINNPGSYKCVRCDRSCNGCTDHGNDHCVECAARFFNDSGRCKPCHRACEGGCTGSERTDCVGACRRGYELVEDQGCVDIDECGTATHHCRGNKYCLNTEGHYQCKSCDQACASTCSGGGPEDCHACKPGYSREQINTIQYYVYSPACDQACASTCSGGGPENCHVCKSGYTREQIEGSEGAAVCTDVDECAAQDQHNCHSEHSRCINTPGSFLCDCDTGFAKDNNGICQEINDIKPIELESMDIQTEDLVQPHSEDDEMIQMSGQIKNDIASDDRDEL